MLALDHSKPADSRADVRPDSGGVLVVDAQTRIIHRFLRRSDRVVDERVHLLDFFFLDEFQRIKVLDFAGDAHREGGNVETSNRADVTATGKQVRPHFFLGVARAANQAHACDYNTTIQTLPPPMQKLAAASITSSAW